MPYEVGEYVIYSSLGICQVIQNDAHVSLAGDENELYYILAPIEKRLCAPLSQRRIETHP